MTTPLSSTASKKTKKDDVEALLSDLDNLDPTKVNTASEGAPQSRSAKADDAQSLLDDLDDLVKRRAPTPKKPSLLSNPTAGNATSGSHITKNGENPTPIPANTLTSDGASTSMIAAGSSEPLEETSLTSTISSGAGKESAGSSNATSTAAPVWGNWWNSATKLADQARAELEKRAAQVQSQVVETAKEASEAGNNSTGAVPWAIAQNVNSFLKNNRDLNKLKSDLSKAGIKGWNDLLNVVVPPIEQHEILSVTLSHDMVGFDGISDVVFAVLQRVMETHASSKSSEQQLVINKAPERTSTSDTRPSEEESHESRNLKALTGFEQGWKLAESKLAQLIESKTEAAASEQPVSKDGISLPITTCPLYIRIQPVLNSLPGISNSSTSSNTISPSSNLSQPTHLFMQVLLRDPKNSLTHKTISQPIPKAFIDLNFEDHVWVEELLSESLQGALGSIALQYIQGRNLGTSLRSDVVEAAAAHENNGKPVV